MHCVHEEPVSSNKGNSTFVLQQNEMPINFGQIMHESLPRGPLNLTTYPVNVAGTRNIKPPTKYMKPWYQLRVAEYTLLKTKFPTTTLNKLMRETMENTDPEINPQYVIKGIDHIWKRKIISSSVQLFPHKLSDLKIN